MSRCAVWLAILEWRQSSKTICAAAKPLFETGRIRYRRIYFGGTNVDPWEARMTEDLRKQIADLKQAVMERDQRILNLEEFIRNIKQKGE